LKLWHRWDRTEHDYVKQMFGLGPRIPPADRLGSEVSLAPPQAVTAGQPHFSEVRIARPAAASGNRVIDIAD
jgi:hypothetical protein